MSELTKQFYELKPAQDFSDIIWKILSREITETDDAEIQAYIDFFNENDNCNLLMRKVKGGVEIGISGNEDFLN